MENIEEIPIVFAYWYNNEFQGFRADTFNTISKDQPKIYSFSKEQVETVIGNVKSGCNNAGKALMKMLEGISPIVTSICGDTLPATAATAHVSKTEQQFREWGVFEVRVHPFTNKEEYYSLGEGDEWKKAQILNNLEPAIEIYKFKVVENEN